jgi:hypothetical protein
MELAAGGGKCPHPAGGKRIEQFVNKNRVPRNRLLRTSFRQGSLELGHKSIAMFPHYIQDEAAHAFRVELARN